MNLGTSNGISGLKDFLLINNLYVPFIISVIIMTLELVICGYEAYFRK